MRIAIIVPTYNEAENLPKLVSALFSLPLDLSIWVVDDNSPDGTGPLADDLAGKDPRVHVIHRAGKLGLRSAYVDGIHAALPDGAEAIVQMDADFSHDPARLPDMARKIESCDLVLGSRYVPGGAVDREWPRWRRALSAFANFYARSILSMPQRDITTGFRMWRRATLQGMPLDRIRSNGYVFLVEMVYLAYCLGYQIGEVPIYFADRKFGASKMSIKIQVEAAFRVWQVWWGYRGLRRLGASARVS